jgi:hypothetical protein
MLFMFFVSFAGGRVNLERRGQLMRGYLRSTFCLIASLAMTSTLAMAQTPIVIDFGVRGGLLFGQPLQANPSFPGIVVGPIGRPYSPPTYTFDNVYGTVGPAVGALLYDRVEVRFESVYKRFSYVTQSTLPPAAGASQSFVSTAHGHSWEYPLLATYRFGSGPLRPFLGGGLGLGGNMRSTGVGQIVSTIPNPSGGVTKEYGIPSRFGETSSLATAFYASGGVDGRTSILSIRPELRYTRWPSDVGSNPNVMNKPNQWEFLVGVSVHPFRFK